MNIKERSAEIFAEDMYMLYAALRKQNFSSDQTFELVKAYVNSCGFATIQNINNDIVRRIKEGDIHVD